VKEIHRKSRCLSETIKNARKQENVRQTGAQVLEQRGAKSLHKGHTASSWHSNKASLHFQTAALYIDSNCLPLTTVVSSKTPIMFSEKGQKGF